MRHKKAACTDKLKRLPCAREEIIFCVCSKQDKAREMVEVKNLFLRSMGGPSERFHLGKKG